MTTVVPQSELTRRALDWIGEHGGTAAAPARRRQLIEEAAARFNLSPLEVEFLERFLSNSKPAGQQP
jgi:hypothetical protein